MLLLLPSFRMQPILQVRKFNKNGWRKIITAEKKRGRGLALPSHQAVIFHHLLHRVRQRKSNRQRKTFRNRYHNDGDRYDRELRDTAQRLRIPGLVLFLVPAQNNYQEGGREGGGKRPHQHTVCGVSSTKQCGFESVSVN